MFLERRGQQQVDAVAGPDALRLHRILRLLTELLPQVRQQHVTVRLQHKQHVTIRLQHKQHVTIRLQHKQHVTIRLQHKQHVTIRLQHTQEQTNT